MAVAAVAAEGQVTGELLNLDPESRRAYSEMDLTPYNQNNIARGDSLYKAGKERGEENTMAAGAIVMGKAYLGANNIVMGDSLMSLAANLIKDKEEYRKVKFAIYSILIQIKMASNKYSESLEIAQNLTSIAIKENDPLSLGTSYMSMGLTFILRDNPRLAAQSLHKAAEMFEKSEDMGRQRATCYLHLANCYDAMNEGEKCREYIDKAIEEAKKIAEKSNGNKMLYKQIELYKPIMNTTPMSNSEIIAQVDKARENGTFDQLLATEYRYALLGKYYAAKGQKKTALAYIDSIETECNRNETRETVYRMMNDWENAYKCKQRAYQLHDSLQAVIQSEDFATNDAKMNNVQLRAEAELLKEKNDSMKEKMVIGAVALVVILGIGTAVVSGVMRRRRLQEQKKLLEEEVNKKTVELREKNCILEEQQEEILAQNEDLLDKSRIIEQINTDITDSINYASRIQTAILPDLQQFVGPEGIAKIFSVYIPYKTVSGDFYWARQHGEKQIFVCSDCTGHGVPGALMSMIGATLLNEVTQVEELPTTGELLTELDRRLKEQLDATGEKGIQDGMDLTIAVYTKSEKKLEISAARRPVYIRQNGVLNELKGTKRCIGDRDEVSCKLEFDTFTLTVEKGDVAYLCSDGFADQIGGVKNPGDRPKRLKNSGVKQWIEDVKDLPIAEQGAEIDRRIMAWKEGCEQMDDITMLGIEF